jgi:hypothetical protein
MPQTPAHVQIDPQLAEHKCPKCGAEMEPIDANVEGLPLQELELCPGCYLVTWTDQDGPHFRQGVPWKTGEARPGEPNPSDQGWSPGEPEEC